MSDDYKRLRSLMKPAHQHDCTRCVYLGSMFMDCESGIGDWYRCSTSSVVCRLSSDGPDYWSIIPEMLKRDDLLVSAVEVTRGEYRYGFGLMKALARFMLDREKLERGAV